MKIQLNGWQRLLVVVAFLHLILVVAVVWAISKDIDYAPHDYSFYSGMSEDARNVIMNTRVDARYEYRFVMAAQDSPNNVARSLREAHEGGDVERARSYALALRSRGAVTAEESDEISSGPWLEYLPEAYIVEMPNRHQLVLVPDSSEKAAQEAAQEYHRIVERASSSMRMKVVAGGFLGWILPLGLLYLIGMVSGWVYRGFRSV